MTSDTASPAPNPRLWILALAVTLVGGALYLNSLNNPFVFDDFRVIVENPSLENLNSPYTIVVRDITRPLANLSYAVDRAIWGPRPFGFHLTSVLLHMVNTLLVFYVAWLLAWDRGLRNGTRVTGTTSSIVASSTTVLFAIHPMLTQAVGYISARAELIALLFFMLAFVAARRWMVGGGMRWWGATFALWAAAMAGKEVAVMLPGVLLAYDRLMLPGDAAARRRLQHLHAPFIGLMLVAAAVRVALLVAVEYPLEHIDGRFALVAIDAVRQYALLLVAPTDQSIFHALQPIDGLSDPAGWVALGTLAAVLLFVWIVRRVDPLIAFGVLWFMLLLVPSTVLFTFGRGEPLAEHRVYGASVGFFLAMGSYVGQLVMLLSRFRLALRLLVYAIGALFVMQLAGRTLIRNTIWSNPVALWAEAIARTPDHWLPRLMFAETLRQSGRCGDAVAEYRKAIDLRPQEPFGYQKLGGCLVELKRLDEAAAVFATLHDIAPRSPDGLTGLGIVGMARGTPEESRRYFLAAIERDPSSVAARQLLAAIEESDHPADALRLCEEIQRLAPATAGNDECIRRNRVRVDAAGEAPR